MMMMASTTTAGSRGHFNFKSLNSVLKNPSKNGWNTPAVIGTSQSRASFAARCSSSTQIQDANRSREKKGGRQFPDFLPDSYLAEIEETACLDMAASMRRVNLTPNWEGEAQPVPTSVVSTQHVADDHAPVVMLHGFDSSCLEFRRIMPLLEERRIEAHAVDLVGWGFTDAGAAPGVGPEQKRAHLEAFWREELNGRPITLLGCSLGGAVAIDFALSVPEAVKALVLVDAQGFIDGLGAMSSMPQWAAKLGVSVLKAVPLRNAANKMAYANKDLFATEDAMRVGRLHCHMPNWLDNNVSYMQSGGYSLSSSIPKLAELTETHVFWGAQDEILEPETADKFRNAISNATVTMVDDCGHVAHLEQPIVLADRLDAIVRNKA